MISKVGRMSRRMAKMESLGRNGATDKRGCIFIEIKE